MKTWDLFGVFFSVVSFFFISFFLKNVFACQTVSNGQVQNPDTLLTTVFSGRTFGSAVACIKASHCGISS